LGTLGGDDESFGNAINNNGQVTGVSYAYSDYYYRAFLWSNGVMTDLGTLSDVSISYGINDSGQVTGTSGRADGAYSHAFLWSNGVMTDLNTLISPGSGWELINATGINDAGQITGYGYHNGAEEGFLLTPATPPKVAFEYYPAKPMVGGNITFDASASNDSDGTIVDYQWDFGDGNSGSGQVVTHNYAESNDYTVKLTVIDNDGLSSSMQQTITVFPKVYVLSVGVNVPGEIIRDDIQAERIREAFAVLPGVSQTQLLILRTDELYNKNILEDAINNAAVNLSKGDIFIMYIGAHGFYEGGFDETGVYVQDNVHDPNHRILSSEDEHIYLSNYYDNISDDDFSNLFVGLPWSNINKLFIIDTCFAGGFWGDTTYGDSGDLARLTKVALVPASSEADFAGTVDDDSGHYVGQLGKALEHTLKSLPYNYSFASFNDLVDTLLWFGYQYKGTIGPIKDVNNNWDIPIATDCNIQPQSTFDFKFSLQVRAFTSLGDLDNDGDIDIVDISELTRHWLQIDCSYPNWCEGIDLNHNGCVDFTDFSILAENWLAGK
jgi:probable HAF family extracellular repeat protein